MADSMENIVLNPDGSVGFAKPEPTTVSPTTQPTQPDMTQVLGTTPVVDTQGQVDDTTTQTSPDGNTEDNYYTPDEVRELGLNLDPKRLPPELVPFYKSMQSDYTRKTQEIATRRREIEDLARQFQKPQEQQQQAHPSTMKDFYKQMHTVAKQQAETALGEPLKLVDEYGEPNVEHQIAYQDAIANIKIELYNRQQQEQGKQIIESQINETVGKYRSDPDWPEIADFAVKMMKQIPHEQALELQARFKNGDVQTLDRYLAVVKEEFEKQKYPARRQAQAQPKQSPQQPPLVQPATTVNNQVPQQLDFSKLGSLSAQDQTQFIKAFLASK